MRFEKYTEPVLPLRLWVRRVGRSLGWAFLFVGFALSLGICGYHFIGNLKWIDAILEASMILGGMGAVAPMTNDAIKLFASGYALFSGLVALSAMGVLLAPWLHRMLHHANMKEPKL